MIHKVLLLIKGYLNSHFFCQNLIIIIATIKVTLFHLLILLGPFIVEFHWAIIHFQPIRIINHQAIIPLILVLSVITGVVALLILYFHFNLQKPQLTDLLHFLLTVFDSH